MARILVVEDEAVLACAIRDWLRNEHHLVDIANDAEIALQFLNGNEYDLVVLDLILPRGSGRELCRSYRQNGGNARILVLTARIGLADKQEAFDAGADDYLCKPFELPELSMRVNALMKRSVSLYSNKLQVGELTMDCARHQVLWADKPVRLLPQEFALLNHFMQHPNRVFSADALIKAVWREQSSLDTVRTHIKTLRKKLDAVGAGEMIATVHGVGYSLIEER